MKRNPIRGSQSGFSLLELMIVLGILTLVMGGIFRMVNDAQKRYVVEDTKLDLTQESREFLDQVIRDLHQAGYPAVKMYETAPASGNNSNLVAVGLVRVSHSDIVFEADVDSDGVVDIIRYQLDSSENSGRCPCTLRRSQIVKVDGVAPDSQWTSSAVFSAEVQRVLNSYGTGNSPLVIAGNTFAASNDTLYAAYKAAPVFEFYDQDGIIVSGIPNDLSVANTGNGTTLLASVRSIRVTINTLATTIDLQDSRYPAVSMTSSARIANNRL